MHIPYVLYIIYTYHKLYTLYIFKIYSPYNTYRFFGNPHYIYHAGIARVGAIPVDLPLHGSLLGFAQPDKLD